LKKRIGNISSLIEGGCKKKIVFCLPASALRDSWGSPRKLHTFANRTSQPTDRNLQKSAIFATSQRKNTCLFCILRLFKKLRKSMMLHKILNVQRKPICFDIHTQGYSEAHISFAEKYKNKRQIFQLLLFFPLMKNSISVLLFIFFFFMANLSVYAQGTKADSLMAIFESSKEIEEKQNLLKEIANIYEYAGEWDNYYACVRKMLDLARHENDSSWIAEAYNKLGISSCYTGQNEQAIENFTAALEINKAMNEMASVANSYENLGIVYNEMGDFGNAIECQLKSVEIRKPINYPRLFNNYMNLATLYSAISNDEKRAYYIDLAKKDIASKPGISAENKAVFYSGLGDLYHDKGLNDSSIACYKKVIYYSEQAEWNRGITSGLGSLANVFHETGELDSAIVYHQKSLKLSEQIDECMSITEELTALAKIYAQKRDENKAISHAEKALKKARSCKLLEMESQILEFISGYYAGKGNYKQAYEYYINFKAVTDSILSADVINNMAELETQYQTREKEQQIELLSAENQIKNQRMQFGYAIIALLIVIILLIVLFYRIKRKEARFVKTDLQQKILRAQMKPHFIFNVLGSIQYFMLHNEPSKASGYLSQLASLMRSTLEYSDSEVISLEKEVEMLKNFIELEQMRMPGKFNYTLQQFNIDDPEFIFIPPMLVQPFVENAIKHGFGNIGYTGELNVTITCIKEQWVEFIIEDNGVGFHQQSNSTTAKHASKAMKIFEQRRKFIQHMYGKTFTCKLINKNDIEPEKSGVRIEIRIPLIHQHNSEA
jgi:tetratricopeptide (TPR) repeat protein